MSINYSFISISYVKSIIFFLFILSLFLLTGFTNNSSSNKYYIENAEGSISSTDLIQNSEIELLGQWEYYDKMLLSPDDFKLQNPEKEYKFISKITGYFTIDGYGTYRTKLNLDDDKSNLSLILKYSYLTNFKLWLDNELLFSNGTPSELDYSGKIWRDTILYKIINFNIKNKSIFLTLQLSSNKVKNFNSIYIADTNTLTINNQNKIIFNTLIYGSLLAIATYQIILFIFRRKTKDTLSLALITVSIEVVLLLNNLRNGLSLADFEYQFAMFSLNNLGIYSIHIICLAFTHITSIFFVMYLNASFSGLIQNQKKLYNFIIFQFISTFLFIILTHLEPVRIGKYIALYIDLLVFINIIFVTSNIIFGLSKKYVEAKIIIFGFLLFVATAVNDLLIGMQVLKTQPIMNLGFLLFVISQAALIAYKFSQSFEKTENISKELKETLNNLKTLIEKSRNIANTTDKSVISLAERLKNIKESNKTITNVMQTVAEGSVVQVDKTNISLASIENLGQSADEISIFTNTMKDATDKVIQKSHAGTVSILSLLEIEKSNQHTLNEVNEVVSTLINKINNISDFSKTILAIAQETKLLSLNASIEAAHSKHGKEGFSVISQKIKQLAAQADLKAKEISKISLDILEISKETIQKLKEANNNSNKQQVIVNSTAEIFHSLKNEITESLNQINNLFEKINNLTYIRNTVSESIQEISTITENNSAIVQEITALIEEQNEKIINVNDYMQKLKIESEELTNAINSIELK